MGTKWVNSLFLHAVCHLSADEYRRVEIGLRQA